MAINYTNYITHVANLLDRRATHLHGDVMISLAILNRMRGDDRWMPSWLPGRALYYVAPMVGLIAWLVIGDAVKAAYIAVCYFVWAVFPWGHWIDLGRKPALDRDLTAFERAIDTASGSDDHVSLFIRHCIALPVAMVWWPAVIAPLLFLGAYEAGWRITKTYPIVVAELLVGAIWGLIIIGAAWL